MNATTASGTQSRRSLLALGCCWLAIVFDGYDLMVYGAAVPSLLAEPGWGMTPNATAQIASLTLVGLLVGSLAVGWLSDRLGRRRMVLLSLTVFSVGMAGGAMAASPEMLGLFRLLTGFGLGGLLPAVGTLITELAPAGKKRFYHSLTFTAFPAGGVLAALVAIWLLPDFGWRAVFWVGASPIVLILPPLLAVLPESSEFRSASREAQRGTASSRAFVSLFSRRYVTATVLFALIYATSLFTSYGLLTWLPQIMIEAGFSLRSSLSFLFVMSLTTVAMLPIAGYLAERIGSKAVSVAGFMTAAIPIALLAARPPDVITYLLVGLAGFGAIGLIIQLNAYVANYYDVHNRGSASGWALGIGRLGAIAGPIVGGWLLTIDTSLMVRFLVFAGVSALGGILTLCVPRFPRHMRPSATDLMHVSAGSAGRGV